VLDCSDGGICIKLGGALGEVLWGKEFFDRDFDNVRVSNEPGAVREGEAESFNQCVEISGLC